MAVYIRLPLFDLSWGREYVGGVDGRVVGRQDLLAQLLELNDVGGSEEVLIPLVVIEEGELGFGLADGVNVLFGLEVGLLLIDPTSQFIVFGNMISE